MTIKVFVKMMSGCGDTVSRGIGFGLCLLLRTGCRNKIPDWVAETIDIYFLTVLKATNPCTVLVNSFSGEGSLLGS